MMKGKLKKLAALVMAAAMTFSMSGTVFADETQQTDTAKLSVSKSVESENGTTIANTYTAYEVMCATKKATGTEGAYVYTYEVTEDFKNFFGNSAYGGYQLTAEGEITDVSGSIITSDGTTINSNTTEAAKLATALEKYALANATGTNVPATLGIGYYVVVETESNLPIASKPILVDLRSETTVQPKDDEIDLTKKIVENDILVDANNASINDTIHYQVDTAIPEYEANVDTSKLTYEFKDTFINISFNADLKVFINGEEIKTGYSLEGKKGDSSFTLSFSSETIAKYQGAAVKLTYSGTLTADAKIDSTDGNPNHVKLTYTNNPNQSDSKGILEDEVTTYTYGFQIRKVDKNDDTKDMSGATFAVKDAKGTVIGSFTYGDDGTITNTKGVVTLDGNYATIKGVDEGTYTITETKAPEGYALLGSDVVITITDDGTAAGTEPTGIATIAVKTTNATLEGKNADGKDVAGASEISEGNNGTIDVIVRIENVRGISLPETGSTTMLICLAGGAAAVLLGALYFALTRKTRRMD